MAKRQYTSLLQASNEQTAAESQAEDRIPLVMVKIHDILDS